MKKVVMYVVLFFVLLLIPVLNVYAGRGCCSHHGGQAYCSASGRWICRDGTASPTCMCSGGSYNGSSSSGGSSYRTTTTTRRQVYGCTNSSAINYNSNANISDGSCQFEKTETKTESINYETETIGALNDGTKKVVTEGEYGEKEVTVKTITNESGEQVSSEVVKEEIIKEPVKEVIKYEETSTKVDVKANEESNNTPLIITIILLVINVIIGNKHIDAKLIINWIRTKDKWIRYILYFLYFIFIIPVFIDTLLIIIYFIKNHKQ